MLSETRDMDAAEKSIRAAKAVTDVAAAWVATDGHDSYPGTIRSRLGADARHWNSQYLNNYIQEDHQGTKSEYGPMRGFGAVNSTTRICQCHDQPWSLLHANRRFRQSSSATARSFLQASRFVPRVMASS